MQRRFLESLSEEMPIILPSADIAISVRKKRLPELALSVIRPHQWVKNLFIFAPLLFGRKLTDPSAAVYALMAFCVFCCLSSATYIFNDWIDVEEDKAHPEKRHRPISSGELSAPIALALAAALSAIAFVTAWQLDTRFFLIALLYLVLTLAYSLSLKRVLVLDCIVIASGFVMRVVGGAIAIAVVPTHWLIACAFLLALFLAFSKRRQELLILSDSASDHRKVLGQYSVSYLEQVNLILIGAAVVSYALYTVAPETIQRFGTDALIYGTVFVIYGMLRYLALINDPEKGGNPSKMLLHDRPLLLTVTAWSFYNAIIIYRIPLLSSLEPMLVW